MYYDIEEEARRQEPDIDEELQKLEDCKVLATQIYESSEKQKKITKNTIINFLQLPITKTVCFKKSLLNTK